MPMSEAAKEKMRRNKRDENGNVKPEIYERLKKAHEAQREKKRQRRQQKERDKELEKLRQEAEEARKMREIDDLKRQIGASAANGSSAGGDGARAQPERRDEAPRQTQPRDEERQGRPSAQEADPPHGGDDAGEKPPEPNGQRDTEVRGEESTPHAAPRSHEPPQPGGVRDRRPDGDGLDTVGAVDKRTKDRIAAYAFPNGSIPAEPPSEQPAQPKKPPKAKRTLPVNRVII